MMTIFDTLKQWLRGGSSTHAPVMEQPEVEEMHREAKQVQEQAGDVAKKAHAVRREWVVLRQTVTPYNPVEGAIFPERRVRRRHQT